MAIKGVLKKSSGGAVLDRDTVRRLAKLLLVDIEIHHLEVSVLGPSNQILSVRSKVSISR